MDAGQHISTELTNADGDSQRYSVTLSHAEA
jgi:hypothetical protein